MSAKVKVPLGIFWDIENCAIPLTKSASGVAKQIRDFISVKHPECGFANEFFCSCDTTKLDSRITEGLNRNGVIVAHVNSGSKNAADDKLQELIDMFIDKFGSESVLVVITGDINFAKPIRNARRKNIDVLLIHGINGSQDLKNLVKESYLYEDILKQVDSVSADANQLKPAYLKVTKLPKDRPIQAIAGRLSKLSENCGGKPENVGNGKAMIRFGCRDDAQRALQRMSGEDCFGHKFKLRLIDPNSKPETTVGNTNERPIQTNISSKSPQKPIQMIENQRKLSQNTANNSEDRKSVIKGLETRKEQNVTQLVKNIVNSWKDRQINGNSIQSVERNTKQQEMDGKIILFVTAVSADASKALVDCAQRHIKDSDGIKWRQYVHKIIPNISGDTIASNSTQTLSQTRNKSLSQQNLSQNINNSVNNSDECKSVIKGLFTRKGENVTQIVRQLVSNWNDNRIKSDSIKLVNRSFKYGSGDGKVTLFVTAISAQASHALVMSAKKYINPNDGIRWYHFKPKDEIIPQPLQLAPESPPRLGQLSKADKTLSQQNLAQNNNRNDCKSVIRGLETKSGQNVVKVVRNLVYDWKDSTLTGNFIVEVQRDGKQAQSDGKVLLFVTTTTGDQTQALITGAKKYLNPNDGIEWTSYTTHRQRNQTRSRSRVRSINTNADYESNGSDIEVITPYSSTLNLAKCSSEQNLFDIPVSDDCKSIITGLTTKSGQNVAKVVRKLVMDWKDSRAQGNYIVDVVRDPNYTQEEGNAPLLVTASTAQTCEALITSAVNHLESESGIVWTHYNGCQQNSTSAEKSSVQSIEILSKNLSEDKPTVDKSKSSSVKELKELKRSSSQQNSIVKPNEDSNQQKSIETNDSLIQQKVISKSISIINDIKSVIDDVIDGTSFKKPNTPVVNKTEEWTLLSTPIESNADNTKVIIKPQIPCFADLPLLANEILIRGSVPKGAKNFSFNLYVGTIAEFTKFNDIAFHISPRFGFFKDTVVRNSRTALDWGPEERDLNSVPFSVGKAFEALIQIEDSVYKVFVDGRHFIDFRHRMPVSSVGVLSIEGSVDVDRVEMRRKQQNNASLNPVVFKPSLPFHRDFAYGLREGFMLCIAGRLNTNTICLAINFHAFSDIAFQLIVHNRQALVVLNSQLNGRWGSEELSNPCYPFAPNTPFDVMIRIESKQYVIAVNGQHFCDYKHRIAFNSVNGLSITGDVLIDSIRFANK